MANNAVSDSLQLSAFLTKDFAFKPVADLKQ